MEEEKEVDLCARRRRSRLREERRELKEKSEIKGMLDRGRGGHTI
jgi:hypothetical protein